MRAALAILAFLAMLGEANATCGTRGGPGYRAPSGKCVGWQEIGRLCGSPPSERCTAEKVDPDAGKGSELGVQIEHIKNDAHSAVDKQ